ncbi:glycosyltransferase [Lactococcus garvieae]|uniref:glycosyltransferase family 2 protein n=1 Tax=Lactococcus garvieae TaxID=1363 RepID=UPI001F614376|nr:glycosyltransferase [Lactococcus garvieae]MCI3859719.1 glycosyltransferase [Lactococcus garvieae]
MEKLITVVIPCYNAEKSIETTIKSVIGQTLSLDRISILAINDGSTDGTQEKLEEIKNNYPELINIVDQENKGAGPTRSRAIGLTKTKYLTFLDADDTLEKNFLKKLLKVAETDDFDVVSCGAKRITSSGEVIKEFKIKKVNEEWSKWIIMSSWGKLYRTRFLKDNDIKFLDSLFGEDAFFILDIILKGAKFKLLDYLGYNWIINPESMTSTQYDGLSEYNSNQIIMMLNAMISLKTQSGDDDLFSYFILKQAVNRCLSPGKRATPEEFIKHYKRTIELLERKYPKALQNKFIFKGPEGEEKFVRYAIAGFVTLHRLKLMPLFSKIYCKGKKQK